MGKYKLSPSKAHIWLDCTLSLLDDTFVETPATVRGTILHEIGEKLILGYDVEARMEKHQLNEYERFNVMKYAETVWEELDKIPNGEIYVENKVTLNIYQNSINMILDALIVGKHEATIVDFKSGNFDIEIEDNKQMLFYSMYVVTAYPHIQKINTIIFQKGKPKKKTLTPEEVIEFFKSKEQVFDDINNDRLSCTPSETVCRFASVEEVKIICAKWIVGGKK